MDAHHLRNETLEVTNSDLQDSATVLDEGTPSVFIVANNDNDSHGSAQIQDMLADVLSTLNNIQSQNAKANEELGAKLMVENQKLADRLTEQVQHEITKVTEAICQLREETRREIQSVRDDLNKLSTSVDERVSRHINNTKEQHDNLRKEMITELKVAKQEINTFMQDVNKNNQEVRDSFGQSERANAQKFAELDREVAELREQISRVANDTSVPLNDSTLSDASQVQPSQRGNNAVSVPCTSNSSCMTESIEIGCSRGMNGNALNGNVCSMTPTNVSAPTIGGQILPELSLPTFSSREQSAVHFLKDLDEYLKLKSVDERLKLTLVSKSLTEEFAKNWFMATKEHINSYEEFKIKFLDQFWSKESQSHTRAQIYRCRYDKSTDGCMASHLLKYAVLGTSLQPPMSELEVIEAVTSSYPPWVQKLFVTSNIKTIQDALSVLNKLEAIEGQHHNSQQWSNQNRPPARSSYSREEHRDGRTHAVRQTYVSREQRRTRNSRYPEQEGYDVQETYRRSGNNRRNYSPHSNMTNASTLNAEATPYNQARSSQENETENRRGNFRGTE